MIFANWISRSAAALPLVMATGAIGQTAEVETIASVKPPVPVAFEGAHALGVAAVRQRILSQNLRYELSVDEQGNVTDCHLPDGFRRKATEHAMCRPFERHMTFEPALDADGNPTAGTYAFTLNFDMFMTQKGNLEPRFNRGLARREED